MSYFVVGLNVELNLLAGQGAHSTWAWLAAGCGVGSRVLMCSLDLHVVWFLSTSGIWKEVTGPWCLYEEQT